MADASKVIPELLETAVRGIPMKYYTTDQSIPKSDANGKPVFYSYPVDGRTVSLMNPEIEKSFILMCSAAGLTAIRMWIR